MCSPIFYTPKTVLNIETNEIIQMNKMQEYFVGWDVFSRINEYTKRPNDHLISHLKDGVYWLTLTGAGPYPTFAIKQDDKVVKIAVTEWDGPHDPYEELSKTCYHYEKQ